MSRETHALLVHGMGRTPVSLSLLAARLRRAGLRTHLFGYAAALDTFDGIARRLAWRAGRLAGTRWVAVGHSLGGLLLRAAIERLTPEARPGRLVMLGTPNRGSLLARQFRRAWWFRLYNGDCGRLLGDPARVAALPPVRVPTRVIAGTLAWPGGAARFGGEPSDGVVALSETRLEGVEHVERRVQHTVMMHSAEVARLVLGAAREGSA